MTDNFNNNNNNDDDLFDSLDLKAAPVTSTEQTGRGSRENRDSRKTVRVRELNSASTAIDRKTVKKEKETKKKSRIKKIILWSLLEIITLAAIFTYGYFLRSWNLITRPEVNESNIENPNLSAEKKEEMEKGYWTFAVFGVDGRNASDLVSKGLNSDVILIVNINQDTGEIRLCSVFRDTYLNINEKNSFRKINQAYSEGGPEQALAALNKNLDLNIKNYVTFNWKAVADGINILGGIDGINISKAELYYINAFITETVKVTKIGSYQLTSTGEQHLDGVQAVAYGRLRLMDDDFARTERQKRVIKACFDKAKQSNFSVLNNIMVVCFPEVATNIGFNTVVEMAQNITKYNITESGGFPWQRSASGISSIGDVVVPATLESNVKYLHKFLFDDENYEPSTAVLNYSETIKEKSHVYKEGQVVESVRTDGGLISSPKKTEASTEETKKKDTEESEKETDEDGNVIEKPTIGLDDEGNLVYPTDEDGNKILPTDEDGNVIYPKDEDGNTVYPTDEDGNPIIPETKEHEDSPGELSHGDDNNEDEDDDNYGPGHGENTTTPLSNGPGNPTEETEPYGPGVEQTSETAERPFGPGQEETTQGGMLVPGGMESSESTNVPGNLTPGDTGGPGSEQNNAQTPVGPGPGSTTDSGSGGGPGDSSSAGGSSPGSAPMG